MARSKKTESKTESKTNSKASVSKQKLKLIYLLKILEMHSDAQSGIMMPQIIEHLEELGIPAERKSLYRDIEALRDAGYNIEMLPTRPPQYAYIRSELGFDEVMMLIDAVQSSRFLTERKSDQLVKSLKNLVSVNERQKLAKRVHVHNRIKHQSESVFHSVDIIHEAIQKKRKIEFLYFSYNANMDRRPRHEGKRYVLTPVKIVYAEGNYYLAAFDDEDDQIKIYRIDRMELLQLSKQKATRCDKIANYEYEDFTYQSFGMFQGDPATVTLKVETALMDAVVDRFGNWFEVVKATEKNAEVRVMVQVSPQFFGWIAGLDGHVTIKSPKKIADQYKTWLKNLASD